MKSLAKIIVSAGLAGVLLLSCTIVPSNAQRTLAERLGYKATDKILIVNGDDIGMCHTGNLAAIDCMEHGLMTCGTIMVPCPWFTEIARYAKAHPKRDFGLHLTHTSEWQVYRWGPVASKNDVKGLLDPEGYFWRDDGDVHKRATPQEAYIEAKAQIQKALAAGIDVTHLDSHMGTMQLDPRFHEMYVKLALEFHLPLRMGSQSTMEKFGAGQVRKQVAGLGIVFPDYLIHEERDGPGPKKELWMNILRSLKPGVTELYIHAGLRTDEMKAIPARGRFGRPSTTCLPRIPTYVSL